MQGEEAGLVVVRGRVEIDMRQPFRSVREAVALFGEKILAGQVYGSTKLKQMEMSKGASTSTDGQYDHKSNMTGSSNYGSVAQEAELEKTKQILQKAKEQGDMMAHCLTSLKQELEHTKRELDQIKMMSRRNLGTADDQLPAAEENFEELKFVSSAETSTRNPGPDHIDEVHGTGFEFNKQQKRSVKFASPPLLTKLITDDHTNVKDEGETQTKSSKKKIKGKIKPLVPLIAGLFGRIRN